MSEMKLEIPKQRDKDVHHIADMITSLVKVVCGVANNASWMACLEAYDKAKTHPRFRKRTVDGRSVKWMFKRVIEAHKEYERNLLYGGPPYFFRLSDLPAHSRKYFGDISDSDYFDMWTAVGAKAYENTRPFVTCLANKFKLSLEKHGVEHPDICAWVITATTCLKIALRVYTSAMKNVGKVIDECTHDAYSVTENELNKIFKPFSLGTVYKLWVDAEFALDPCIEINIDDPTEMKNLTTGIQQIEEQWMDYGTMYGSMADVFEQYDDVWRTPGEQKKAIKGVMEMQRSCNEDD